MRLRAHGALSGAARIIEPLVARMLRKQFAQHVATLKQVMESVPVTGSTPVLAPDPDDIEP